MKYLFTECKTCGVRFNWALSTEEPQCERCKTIFGNDVRAIVAIMGEHKVPGQRELLRVLNLIIDRIEKLEVGKGR